MNKQAKEDYQNLWNEFIEVLPTLVKMNGAARSAKEYTRKLNNLFTKIFETTDIIDEDSMMPNDDRVNHPSHYTWLKDLCGIEVIDITRHMDFDLGNAVKYLLRQGKKSEKGISDKAKAIEDLKKAIFYINDKIKMLELNK